MISLFRKNLRNKLLLLLGIVFLLISAAVTKGFSTLDKVISHYNQLASNDVVIMADISDMNISFKVQVQEWKNTLIRGSDAAQREKYWSRFNEKAEIIQTNYQQLLRVMNTNHPAFEHVKAFAKSYPTMVDAYKKGYQAFVQSGLDIAVADKTVSGIDRKPTEQLNNAIEAVNAKVSQFSADLVDEASQARTVSIVTMLLAMLVAIALFAWYISFSILGPLNKVTQASETIANGDFTQLIDVDKQDQIGLLARNFNQVQYALNNMIGNLNNDIETLNTLVEEQLKCFTFVDEGLNKQVTNTQTLNQKMQEVDDMGNSIKTAVNDANKSIDVAREQTDKGMAIFEQNVGSGQAMLDATSNAANIIEGLQKDSENIGTIITVINGIAEQTNLLALNAAIEAARAGESGRGFAVVADEVRTLANKTQQSTKQISDSIEQLQLAADKAVKAMSTGQHQADISMGQIRQSQEFIQNLYKNFTQISEQNREVESVVGQQHHQSNSVRAGLVQIAELSLDSQQHAVSMRDASEKLTATLSKVRTDAQRFKIRSS